MSIVTKPPLKPDNKHYLVRGIVDGKENTYYRVKYESYNDLHYFMFRLSKTLSSPNFRVGSGIRIVGKLIRVDPYTTVAGAEKYMCIFEAVGIE